ncbi:MAG TPA: inorganic pyrophosphatase [Anaerolineae bacterium]|nr:inorganic pyrophosphatase [Anaerolineae bacterium]
MNFPKPFYRWRPHPWHGLEVGKNPPELVSAFIEITPFDAVKYEVDKMTGYTMVDRPQRSSAFPPTLYGFVPRTFCHDNVRALSPGSVKGDEDPLDICVFSERPINRGEIIISARVVGGLQMIDGGEADDKIIAVLENDQVWGDVTDVSELPDNLIKRLQHYFSTYKMIPGEKSQRVTVETIYGRDHALQVVEASIKDYELVYGG